MADPQLAHDLEARSKCNGKVVAALVAHEWEPFAEDADKRRCSRERICAEHVRQADALIREVADRACVEAVGVPPSEERDVVALQDAGGKLSPIGRRVPVLPCVLPLFEALSAIDPDPAVRTRDGRFFSPDPGRIESLLQSERIQIEQYEGVLDAEVGSLRLLGDEGDQLFGQMLYAWGIDGWGDPIAFLFSDRNEDRTASFIELPSEHDVILDDFAVVGPGPDELVLPDSLESGVYRICEFSTERCVQIDTLDGGQ